MAEDRAPKRLLFAVPFPPRPDGHHGGSRTIAQLLLSLATRHDVGLLYLRGPGDPPIDPVVAARCAWTEMVRRSSRWPDPLSARRRARLAIGLMGKRPTWVTRWSVRAYRRRLHRLARDWNPSIVQLEFHIMGQYLEALEGCSAPRVLVEHEPGIAAARDRYERAAGLERLLARWELAAWDRFEPRMLRRVQAAVVFTERDRAALAALVPHTRIVRIPVATQIPAQPLDPLGTRPPALLFVGNYIHPPNVDAALRLARDIFPGVAERHPDAELHLVGAAPPAEVRRLAGARVTVAGGVPDVTSHLARAAVVVVPLRLGGGMRVKVLEALAAGKAVIASRRAVEGLDLTHGEQLLIAETDAEFVAAAHELLADPARRGALAARGRSWAQGHLSWERVADAYDELYRELAG
jgi:glycosyltransferase involved in cell wall biosynthesis